MYQVQQLMIYSSRFYEELKTFSWTAGKAQAKRGFNDDLVMSAAIGTWLYDTSSEYGKTSKLLNDAMLKSMKRQSREYDDTPGVVANPVNVFSSYRKNPEDKTAVRSDIRKSI